MTRRLPGYEQVAATRAEMRRAKAVHEAVHAMDPLLVAYAESGEWPPGAEAQIGGYLAQWPEFDGAPDAPLHERATVFRAAMLPLAHRDHDLEHALEQLLFDQYHALVDDPDWADVKAILEPLYAERQEMFSPLADAWHARELRRVGTSQVEQLRAIVPAFDPAEPVSVLIAVASARAVAEGLAPMVETYGFGPGLPEPLAEDADLDALVAWITAYDRWWAGELGATAALAAGVDRTMARWDEINATIESHTG